MTQDEINEMLQRLQAYTDKHELLELDNPVGISIELEVDIPFTVDAVCMNDGEPVLIERGADGNVFPPLFFVEEDDREKVYAEIISTLDHKQ